MMKALALPDNYREGNLHEAPSSSIGMAEARKFKADNRRKKSSSIEFGFLNRAAASTGVIPTRLEASNSFEYMLSDDEEEAKQGSAKGPAEIEIKAGEKRSRDAAFKKHSCSLDAQTLSEKRGRERACSNPQHISFVPVALDSALPVPRPPSPKAQEEEDEELKQAAPSHTIPSITTPRSPSHARTMRKGLSISLPSNSPPRMLPTISPRDLSFAMSDLGEEIERIERSTEPIERTEPKQLTPRCSAPNAVEMAIGGPMVPIALPPQQQEKKPSGLTKESKKTPPSPTTVCPVTVIPRPQRRPIEPRSGQSTGPSVWLPKLNLGALGVGDECPITSPDRSRSVPNILSPRSAFSPRMSPRVGLIPSGPSVNV